MESLPWRTQASVSNGPGFELWHLPEPYVAVVLMWCPRAALTDRDHVKDRSFIVAHSFGDFVQGQLALLLSGHAEEVVMAVTA